MLPSMLRSSRCALLSRPGAPFLTFAILRSVSTFLHSSLHSRFRAVVPLLALALLFSFFSAERAYAQSNPGCVAGTCVSTGPRLANLDSDELLNGLLGSLLGTELNVDVLDYQALANADVTLEELQLALSVATPDALLAEPITLSELLTALNNIDGLSDLDAIDLLLGELVGVPNANEEILLGDLLQIENGAGPFSDIKLNALDLIIGSIQLFNSESLATTPTPITISGSALGLDEIGDITIQAQVIEPPVFVCGANGTSFYSAAVRVKR